MKKKKDKKCYISCTSVQKMKFQRALNTKYQLMFTDSIEDAEIFIAPFDRDGLTERQKRDMEKAETLGLLPRISVESNKILDADEKDPLGLALEAEKEEKKEAETEDFLEEDEGFELELV